MGMRVVFRGRAFLSTPSARRATELLLEVMDEIYDFYPRPPRGGRQWICSE